MSYEPKLAAALSGATMAQLAHWRKAKDDDAGAILVPELSSRRPILYSFRDLIALRMCVALRAESSLQRIRRALRTLRFDLAEHAHLSAYRLVTDAGTILLLTEDEAIDLVKNRAGAVIRFAEEPLKPYYYDGRSVPDLFKPRPHLSVDAGVRGGEPVVAGTRVPSLQVAALVRDGVPPEEIGDFYPGVTAEAARDALDFADYTDSYDTRSWRAAA